METRKILCLEDVSKLIGTLHENIPKFGRQIVMSKKVYNKYFITKLPRKLKKKNKKLGILNLSINYVPPTQTKEITINIGLSKNISNNSNN